MHRQQLVSENAPSRIVDRHGSLISAPITWFDRLLVACATAEWQKMARITGEVLRSFFDDCLLQTSDLILFARARALAKSGVLQWRADLSSMRHCELGLAT